MEADNVTVQTNCLLGSTTVQHGAFTVKDKRIKNTILLFKHRALLVKSVGVE